MSIGKAHQAQANQVRTILEDLAKVAPGEYSDAFKRQLERLDGWTARVAAVGQVKAGKSTFLNALVDQPDILPSDVNPWTSVVTDMRINIESDPALGARFEFFDDKSWDRIINGLPGVREMAEEMLPEFDAEELRRQTEEMRARAQRRLGKYYEKLLGSHHEYDILTRDLLERYVCAGPDAEEGLDREAQGRYTAITKVAHLYLRNPDFAVPTIVTDTPGVNDPFLVRDEFTCQSLNRSEVFLIVLSAHQALTEVDISLIRMLARNGARDVIVFINRIDELDDFTADTARIVEDVSARLFEAAPDRTFSIICGSAWWAGMAIDAETPEAEIAELAHRPEMKRFLTEHRGDCPDAPRERLMVASGLAEVKQRISEAVEYGAGARFLAEVMGETRTQMNALSLVSRRRRDTLQEQIEAYGSDQLEALIDDLEAELAHLEELGNQMSQLIEKAEIDLDAAMNGAWFDLTQAMDAKVHGFLDTRAGMMKEFWDNLGRSKGRDNRLEIDILPLREVMEAGLQADYTTARGKVDEILEAALDTLLAISADEVDAPDGFVDLEDLQGETVVAAFVTARKSVTVKLQAKRTWAFWRRSDLDVKRTMDALRKITAAEVLPSSNKLTEAFTETLAERIAGGKERLRLVLSVVERMIEDRRARLEADRDLLKGAGDLTLLRQKFVNRLQGDIEELEDLIQTLAAKENQLHRRTMINAA